jgi:penicillin-binding protein 1B
MMENVINQALEAEITAEPARACATWASRAGRGQNRHRATMPGLPVHTSNLLCIVWVGNDDYTDIKIQGARTPPRPSGPSS